MNLEQATDLRLQQISDLVHSGVTEMTGKSRRAGGFGEGEFVGRFGGLKPMYPELNALRESPSEITKAIDRGSGPLYERVRYVVAREMDREGFKPARKRAEPKKTVSPHEGRVYCRHCREFHTKGQHRFHGAGSFHQTHLFAFKNPMTHAQAKKLFAEIMAGLKQGLHLSPEGKAVFEQAKAKLRQYRKPVMRNRKRPLSRSKAETMLRRREYSSARQRRFLGARASGYPVRSNRSWDHYHCNGQCFGPGCACPVPARRNPEMKDINGGAVYDITYQKRGPHRCDAECKKFKHMYRHSFTSHPKIYGGENRRELIIR